MWKEYPLVMLRTDLQKNHHIYTTMRDEEIKCVRWKSLILNKDTNKLSINCRSC
jgi:hypothetical protein